MAWSIVQKRSVQGLGVNSQSLAFLASTSAGNTVIAQASWIDVGTNTPAPIGTPTSASGTYAVARSPNGQTDGVNGIAGHSIFYIQNAGAGTHNTTFSRVSGAATPLYIEFTIYEISGLTATPFDVATSNGSNSGASTTTGNTGTTGTLAQSNELVLAGVMLYAGTGLANCFGGGSTPTTGYTEQFVQGATNASVGSEFATKTSSSTTGQIATLTWTSDSSQFVWQASIATFKETGGGADVLFGQACL